MKKVILLFIILILCLFCFNTNVNAEVFKEGDYIPGEYITKEHNGTTYYMTLRYITGSDGSVAYCLEPYSSFVNNSDYTKSSISSYKKLSAAKLKKIQLLVYYGFGYTGRTTSEWYSITQYLIWTTIDSSDNIYFTSTLNGTRFDKYATKKSQLLADVEKHIDEANVDVSYDVNYGEDLKLEGLGSDYSIVSSPYEYTKGSYYTFNNLKESGVVSYVKTSAHYKKQMALFLNDSSQDLISIGNLSNSVHNISVNVLKGKLTLDIRKDDSVYSNESSFKDTCYEILDESESVIDTVCTGEDGFVYETVDLPYGTYSVRQISIGKGFIEDINIYTVTINSSNTNPSLIINNYLIKNVLKIEKYYCVKNNCRNEDKAVFGVYDNGNNLVTEMTTNSSGVASINLGFGTYVVKQLSGREGYDLVDDFSFRVVTDGEVKKYSLFDNEKSKPVIQPSKVMKEEEDKVIVNNEPEEMPPDTGYDYKMVFTKLLREFLLLFKIIFMV